MPGWLAWIVQMPPATSVTMLPATVHVPGVREAKLTGRPEEAVAVRPNAPVPKTLSASGRS